MRKILTAIAVLLLLPSCSVTRKTTSSVDDQIISAHTVRSLRLADTVEQMRLTDLSLDHPKLLIVRQSPTDTTVVVIEAERLSARDSISSTERIETAQSDTTEVTGKVHREIRAEQKPTPNANWLLAVSALLAGLFIGLSLRGTDLRR